MLIFVACLEALTKKKNISREGMWWRQVMSSKEGTYLSTV